MKVSPALKLCLTLCSSLLLADSNLDNYLSDSQQKEFSLSYEKSKEQSKVLRDSWISPLQMRYSYSKSNSYDNLSASQSAAISLDQTIFQSGGIYYGIKYAEATRKYSDFSTDLQKRKLIKEVISLLVQIKQTQLRVEKQKLEIENATINVKQQKERYLSGQLDSGLLDDAILKEVLQEKALYDIETSKEKLVSLYKALSDGDYEILKSPKLEMMSKESFLDNNIELLLIRSEQEKNAYYTDVTRAKYLPRLSLTGSYNWEKRDSLSFAKGSVFPGSETDYYNFGFRVSMPLDYNSLRDIETTKIDNLKANVSLKNKRKEAIAMYDMVSQNMKNIEKKIELSKRIVKLYSKLYSDTQELYKSGYKTEYDVKTLKNSVTMQELEQKILNYDKELELLNLYEKVVN